MDIQNPVQWLYERRGLSVPELAAQADVTERTVRRWLKSPQPSLKKPVREALQALMVDGSTALERPTFSFIDLFAGIGGMRMAFERIGGRCVATCEWNKYAQVTYRANFGDAGEPFYDDIRSVTAETSRIRDIPDHDILVAGFPCQPFSIAGVSKKNALGSAHGFACETQGTLFFELAKILLEKRPRAFLLENVKNLVSHDRGNTFRVIMGVLREELEYEYVEYRVVDAKGFVPQHRERTLIVGFRKDVGFSWSDVEIPDPSSGPVLSSILHDPAREEPDGRYTLGPRFRINEKYTLTPHLWEYLQNYAAKHRAAGNGFGYGIVDGESVARTLSARYYKDGSEILVRQKRKPPRRLTPRECARLMGFDRPGVEFQIKVSDTQAYKQFGNAVVVPVIEAVARAMVKRLHNPKAPAAAQLVLPGVRRTIAVRR